MWGAGCFLASAWCRGKYKAPQMSEGTGFQTALENQHFQCLWMYLCCCCSSSPCHRELVPPVKAPHEHPCLAHCGAVGLGSAHL